MAFKSEIHVAELASIRTGHTEGDIYYILDNGMLGDLPCKPGDFVEWHNNDWRMAADERYTLKSEMDVALFRFSGTGYPLNSDMNDEFLKGKTVVLMHNPGGTQYDFYYLVRHASGSGHVTMYFKGMYNSIMVADDTWTFYNDSVNAVAIAPLYDSTSTYPTVGTAVMYNGKRYVNNTAINTSENWNPSHWTEKSVEDEIGNVETLLAAL